ncbi:hypothetical protein BHE74_00033831 [Ensete ventricosum]|uniref:Uncharacterized protein n=1 Tax=Ensete ventricosum TaxID=4639 RepID=A0A426YE98_ENSVE|nr:hypothetical protein B296_00046557 [Ensete ventricosum]RWW59246.1 hypothetical protein BHE74_00033831 [Ensete ventricosum]RZS06304.1 hypothetical protein BHM03_00036925 [Ensete ventricosum]
MGLFRLVTGLPGPSGFGSASTAEQVTAGIDASNLTVIVTGPSILCTTSLTALVAFLTMQMVFTQSRRCKRDRHRDREGLRASRSTCHHCCKELGGCRWRKATHPANCSSIPSRHLRARSELVEVRANLRR